MKALEVSDETDVVPALGGMMNKNCNKYKWIPEEGDYITGRSSQSNMEFVGKVYFNVEDMAYCVRGELKDKSRDINWRLCDCYKISKIDEPEQPKKIEELSFVGCENDMITCLQLVRISINEIVRELKRRDRAT